MCECVAYLCACLCFVASCCVIASVLDPPSKSMHHLVQPDGCSEDVEVCGNSVETKIWALSGGFLNDKPSSYGLCSLSKHKSDCPKCLRGFAAYSDSEDGCSLCDICGMESIQNYSAYSQGWAMTTWCVSLVGCCCICGCLGNHDNRDDTYDRILREARMPLLRDDFTRLHAVQQIHMPPAREEAAQHRLEVRNHMFTAQLETVSGNLQSVALSNSRLQLQVRGLTDENSQLREQIVNMRLFMPRFPGSSASPGDSTSVSSDWEQLESGARPKCYLLNTGFKHPDGHLLLVQDIQHGQQILLRDRGTAIVTLVQRFPKGRTPYDLCMLVTAQGSFVLSSSHRLPTTRGDRVVADLRIRDEVFVGDRTLPILNTQRKRQRIDLYMISTDPPGVLEAFPVPVFGLHTFGDAEEFGASEQTVTPSAHELLQMLGCAGVSETDLVQATPNEYED